MQRGQDLSSPESVELAPGGPAGRRALRRIVALGGGHRRRPGRTHRRAAAHPPRAHRHDRPRGRRRRRRHQPHGRARRLALRHRRPPLLHQGARGRGRLARAARRRADAAAPHEPGLLRRQVLRLPAQGVERPAQPGRARGGQVRRLLRLGPGAPAGRHRPASRAGWPPASVGASTASSSRPTPRRCGACRPPRSRPTGPRSASRTCRWARPSSTPSTPARARPRSPR